MPLWRSLVAHFIGNEEVLSSNLSRGLLKKSPYTNQPNTMIARQFDSFEQLTNLFESLRPHFMNWLRTNGADYATAEDVCQDAYTALAQQDQRTHIDYTVPQRAKSYFFTTLLNHYFHLRTRRTSSKEHTCSFGPSSNDPPYAMEPVDSSESPLDQVIAAETKVTMRIQIAKLPVQLQEPLILHMQGLTYAQIAEQLNVGTTTVFMRSSKAKRTLAARLRN